jgi:hypothetical protein
MAFARTIAEAENAIDVGRRFDKAKIWAEKKIVNKEL